MSYRIPLVATGTFVRSGAAYDDAEGNYLDSGWEGIPTQLEKDRKKWLYPTLARSLCKHCGKNTQVTEPPVRELVSKQSYVLQRCIWCGETNKLMQHNE